MAERPATRDSPPVCAGLVLAGGRGERLGGEGKHRLLLGGRSLLERAVERLAEQVGCVLLSCNDERVEVPPGVEAVLPDPLPGMPGPLAGVLAGLEYLAAHPARGRWLLSVPVDTPWFPEDLALRLANARDDAGAEIVVASSGAGDHPVLALWPARIAPLLRAALEEGANRSVRAFQSRFRTIEARWEREDLFHNINTQQDLSAAESRWRRDHA